MFTVLPPGKLLYISGPDEKCYVLTNSAIREDILLRSNHTGVDTRLFVHLRNVSEFYAYNSVVIQSSDTDIFLLALAYSPDFRDLEVIIDRATTKQQKYVNCSKIAEVGVFSLENVKLNENLEI
ncbi:unnamed protein product [Didymodactylos carnosus]|uniref:Uncharacterized protein n=1 Tax=Didymodactylos carnosus TaxID=1234261 RepID=A0A8S3A0P2_9BILA|nr:unnamed protein product [Didymodactylos carnosus]